MTKVLGFKWKNQQVRRDNTDKILEIIGFGKGQDRLYCSLPIEGKMVVFYSNSPSHVLIEKSGLLNTLFEPVYS
jgi:hypothetical protein